MPTSCMEPFWASTLLRARVGGTPGCCPPGTPPDSHLGLQRLELALLQLLDAGAQQGELGDHGPQLRHPLYQVALGLCGQGLVTGVGGGHRGQRDLGQPHTALPARFGVEKTLSLLGFVWGTLPNPAASLPSVGGEGRGAV